MPLRISNTFGLGAAALEHIRLVTSNWSELPK